MKKLFIACLLSVFFMHSAFAQKELSRDERMKWWREARFGMFIHWGDYAELAGMQFTGRNATWIRIKPFRPDCRDFLTSLRAIQPAAAEPAWGGGPSERGGPYPAGCPDPGATVGGPAGAAAVAQLARAPARAPAQRGVIRSFAVQPSRSYSAMQESTKALKRSYWPEAWAPNSA